MKYTPRIESSPSCCGKARHSGRSGPDDFSAIPQARPFDAAAPRGGFVTAIETRALGLAVVALGGGRTAPGQSVDPSVGLDRFLPLGACVRAGDSLARVHAATDDAAQQAVQAGIRAYSLGDAAPTPPPLIERIQ